jgi:DNA gyrase subunit B
MTELIKAGHVFIAQPPLFRIKKGKEEKYLHHEKELTEELMSSATDDLVVILPTANRELRGSDLVDRVHDLMDFRKVRGKLNRKVGNSKLLDQLIKSIGQMVGSEPDWQELLRSQENLQKIAVSLNEAGFETEITYDEEHTLFGLTVRNGVGSPIPISYESLSAAEWKQFLNLYRRVAEFRDGEIIVKDGDKEIELESEGQLIDYVVNSGKKSLTIQRYKGLGEMNPNQLWETTMNPDTRTLLQVNIDDAIETDEIFTILMGDQVEPRRRFIEDNALNVKNLDI